MYKKLKEALREDITPEEKLEKLEDAIRYGIKKSGYNIDIEPDFVFPLRITCPFCYAQMEKTDRCKHCGAKFTEDDDLQPKPSKYEPFKNVSTTFRS